MLLMQFYVLHNNSSSVEKVQRFHTSEDRNQQVTTYSTLRLCSGQAACCSSLTNFIYTKLAAFPSRIIFI